MRPPDHLDDPKQGHSRSYVRYHKMFIVLKTMQCGQLRNYEQSNRDFPLLLHVPALELRVTVSTDCFKKQLKTFLFAAACILKF